MGDKKKAYEWLDKGIKDRADCMIWLLVEPFMDPLRNDRAVPRVDSIYRAGDGQSGSETLGSV